jgi:glycerol-1-phosphate dehydrogenase [NAD(P)+]
MGALEEAFALIEEVDPEKTLPQCEIKMIEIGPEALFQVSTIVQRFIPLNSSIGLIIDKTLIFRKDQDVKRYIQEILEEDFQVNVIVLDDGYPELHASQEIISVSCERAEGVAGIVSIGGGTITDIGKMTSVALGSIPHIVVQTAASVDGYTDNVSVILINGVKRTVPSRWPEALVADTSLIAQAPTVMNRAGYGEINSMFTAPADWRIAAVFGYEKKFHWGPIKLLHGIGEGIEEWAPGLRASNLDSTQRLVNALAIRGIVTGVADTTACLSGIEHLISHMLDMHHGAHQMPIGQHGAQVGVGSVYAAVIWELIFDKLSADPVTLPKIPNKLILKEKLYSAFVTLDPSNSLANECWKDYEKKIDFWIENFSDITSVLHQWNAYEPELRALIKTPEAIVEGLMSSGSPVAFQDLQPVVDEHVGRWSVAHSHLMRNRFIGIDLLEFLGLWNEENVDWVFSRTAEVISSHGVKI